MWGSKGEITQLRQELEQARQRVVALEAERKDRFHRDARTNLLNVDSFRDAAGRELARARRNGLTMSLVLIDIDDFRALNACRGPHAGNAALAAVTGKLLRLTRGNDIVGRTGADELAVLMPDTGLDGARACAARLVGEVESADIDGAGFITVSVGVAEHDRAGSIDHLMAAAAAGLQRARRAGGGRTGALVDEDKDLAAEKDSHADAIEALAVALLERDRYTGEHSESVVEMARAVARQIGLDAADEERIGAAALLHDIGKVAIPDQILNKPSKLDAEEWQLMCEHPVIGERILRAIPGMGVVARIVRHEHESFDGSGYPDGLIGHEIPIGSRIILACDTYHAMTSDRPYRKRMSHYEAVKELARCAGTQFDPQVTEALIGYLFTLQQSGELAVA